MLNLYVALEEFVLCEKIYFMQEIFCLTFLSNSAKDYQLLIIVNQL